MKKALDAAPPQVAPEELIALVTASFGLPEEHIGPSYSTRRNKDGPLESRATSSPHKAVDASPQVSPEELIALVTASFGSPEEHIACSLAAQAKSCMREGRTNMRAMRAEQFSGYEALQLVELPKPAVSDGRVLVRITAAGVTPLDHTILSGKFHTTKVPLILGNEGAGVVEEGGETDFPVGSRVMFWGTYGAFEDGTYSEWMAVRKEDLCLIPDGVDDVSAAGIPVAYLTAQVALTLAGFRAGKTVLAPAIGGSVGNAVTQLARALGAKHAISSTTNHAKAVQAKTLGFNEVIDTSVEKLGDGVRRITGGYGADIVIDGIGGEVLSEALGALALGGSLTTLGYSASRKTTIDVTDLIVPQASIRGLNMFRQPQATITDAWDAIVSLLKSGAIKPIVAKTFPLAEAADALRYLVEGRPFGRVVLTV